MIRLFIVAVIIRPDCMNHMPYILHHSSRCHASCASYRSSSSCLLVFVTLLLYAIPTRIPYCPSDPSPQLQLLIGCISYGIYLLLGDIIPDNPDLIYSLLFLPLIHNRAFNNHSAIITHRDPIHLAQILFYVFEQSLADWYHLT